MKIKEFDEKVRIGSEVVFKGKICHVRDLNRKTHEASLGRCRTVGSLLGVRVIHRR